MQCVIKRIGFRTCVYRHHWKRLYNNVKLLTHLLPHTNSPTITSNTPTVFRLIVAAVFMCKKLQKNQTYKKPKTIKQTCYDWNYNENTTTTINCYLTLPLVGFGEQANITQCQIETYQWPKVTLYLQNIHKCCSKTLIQYRFKWREQKKISWLKHKKCTSNNIPMMHCL